MYYIVSLSITVVLGLAANTSFGGLPVLASLLSRDHYLPHAFALRGDRLVFSKGIWALSAAAAVLLVVVRAHPTPSSPSSPSGCSSGSPWPRRAWCCTGVGTARRTGRGRPPSTGVGAVVTAVATLVFLFTKFTEGAWVVVVVIPLLILLFHRIKAYYGRWARCWASG